MTDVRARRLGRGRASIVARMALHHWAAYGEGRVDLHYGFNTDTARKLQMLVVPGVRALEPVSTWTRARLPRRWPFRRGGLTAERVARFDEEWDALAARVLPAYGVASRRDASYLNWRYRADSAREYIPIAVRHRGTLVGGAVFRAAGDTLQWGDALFDPQYPDAVRSALEHAQRASSCRQISSWFSARPQWWARVLEQLGFRHEPEPRGLTVVYAPFTAAAERAMPAWHYSWGDSDLF
jgi:hypothetical protein